MERPSDEGQTRRKQRRRGERERGIFPAVEPCCSPSLPRRLSPAFSLRSRAWPRPPSAPAPATPALSPCPRRAIPLSLSLSLSLPVGLPSAPASFALWIDTRLRPAARSCASLSPASRPCFRPSPPLCCLQVTEAQHAVAAAASSKFGLILIDVDTEWAPPVANGFAVASNLR